MISTEAEECLYKAASALEKALAKAYDLVKDGVKVYDLCETLENCIKAAGAEPAFPANISINHVAAHYTSDPGDELTSRSSGPLSLSSRSTPAISINFELGILSAR